MGNHRYRTLAPTALARELRGLAGKPSSGKLWPIAVAMDAYRTPGDGALLMDEAVTAFDAARVRYTYKVQRGHSERLNWAPVAEAAVRLADLLDTQAQDT